MRFTLAFVLPVFLLVACRKDPPQAPGQTGNVVPGAVNMNVRFNCTVNGKALTDSSLIYTNVQGEQFSVTKFTYYISNVKLLTTTSVIQEAESYHLIKHVDRDTSFTIKGIPPAMYTGIEFLIGVDSLRNVSGAQTGALDIANDMFWDWHSGYIFLKLEGDYVSPLEPSGHAYAFHIGGFEQPYNRIQKVVLNFPQQFRIMNKGPVNLVIDTELDQFFHQPKQIGFDYYYSNISENTFQEMSVNYRDMFKVRSVGY